MRRKKKSLSFISTLETFTPGKNYIFIYQLLIFNIHNPESHSRKNIPLRRSKKSDELLALQYRSVFPHYYERDCLMECTVRWTGPSGMTFLAESGSGHIVAMDGAPEGGGRDLAPRPMELVLAGTGGCTAYDVVLILKRSRVAVSGCDVTLKAERAETDPKVFNKIHFHFTVRGRDLKPNLVERAIKLSHEKYCSASIMLGKTASITHSFEIVDESGNATGGS